MFPKSDNSHGGFGTCSEPESVWRTEEKQIMYRVRAMWEEYFHTFILAEVILL